MKKLIYSMAALATMLFASCQQELVEPMPQESTVTYTVELPGVQTKAIGDGFNVDQLVYEVWKTDAPEVRNLWNPETATRLYQKTVPMATIGGEQKTTITLNLVHDQNYTVLFWAQNSKAVKDAAGNDVPAYVTEDLRAVTYAKEVTDGSYLSNNENMAAFYNVAFLLADDVEKSGSRRVELKRPFAQLNIATKNTPDEYTVTVNKSKVQISNVPTVFDVAQNIAAKPADGIEASPAVTVEKSFLYGSDYVPGCSATDKEPLTLTVNSQDYEYVAMNYIFASGNVTVKYWIDVTLTATDPLTGQNNSTAATDDVVIENEVPEVPLKENYRTNIIGNLLSSNTTYEVVVDASWDDVNDPELNGDGYEVEIWNGTELTEPKKNADGDFMIEYASDLAWFAAAVNGTLSPMTKAATFDPTFVGQTFILTEDIDLNNQLWIPIGATGKFLGTFDGNGKTISNLNVSTEGKASAGLFANARTVKNLTVKNAVVEGHYKTGVIVGDGLCAKIENCHVDGATVTSTPYNNDDANHVGGIVGYLSAELEAYVKGCSVMNATITGYRDVAGIAGTANTSTTKPEVSGNTVTNVTVIADQTSDYKEVKAANVGEIVGRIHANTILKDNTIGENVVTYVLVDNATRLQNVLLDKNVKTGNTLIRFAADIKGNVTVDQQEGKNIVIDGCNKKFDGTITVDGNSRNNGAETVLIKNINFETERDGVYFVEMNSTDGALRYAHNVTIDNCTFKGNETTVGARFRQCYNIEFSNCEVISGHSLAWLTGCTGVIVKNVTVNTTTGGISLGTSTDCLVEGSTFDVKGPEGAIRADGSVNTTLTVKNTTARAELPLIVRYVSNDYNVVLEDVTLEKGGLYHVVFTSAKEECVPPTSNYSITGADNYAVFPINADGSYTDEEGNTVVQTNEGLKAALEEAKEGDIIKVEAGEYAALTDVDFKAGVTIDATGAVFTGTSKLNINGSEVIGATFSNPSGIVVDQTINGTFKNCTFTGKNAVRWSYSGDTCVFEDCVFDGETYGFHSDGGSNPITFIRCSFSGFNAFAGAIPMVTFEDCVFKSNGKSGYNGANLWGSATFKNTKFMFDGSASNEWIDCIGTDKSYEFTGCTIGTDGSLFQPELIFSRNNGTNVTIDGKGYTWIGYFADADGNTYVTNVADLQTVVDNAPVGNTTIHILNNLAGDATVAQKPDVKLVIDGNNKNYDGMITVDGKSATYTTAGLTIKDLTFNAQAISGDACIRLGNGTDATRYTCNVTVDNCTFDVPGAVGVKSYTGGDKNLTITGCTATTNAHSLVQASGIDGILIQKCKLYSKNGMNFNQSTNVVVDGCTADVKGYAARFGASSGATGAAEVYAIKNSTLKSACEDGDAVVILRATADNSTLTIENTNLVGTPMITNNATGSKVFIDGKYCVYTSDTFAAALANKEKNIVLMPGTYKGTFAIGGDDTTIDGSNNAAVVDCINLNGKNNVTLKNIKFDAAGAQMAYDGKGKERYMANIMSGGASKNNKGTRGLVVEGCTFTGTFANGGTVIAFNDQSRGSGQSGDITIKGCTFATEGAYVDIYTYYSGYGKFIIENNIFNSTVVDRPIYLGQYQSSTPVVVKGNTFENCADFAAAALIQPHSSGYYTVSFDESGNTFAE